MKTLLLHMVLLSSFIVGVHLLDHDEDEACNCDHCLKTNENDEEVTDDQVPSAVLPLRKEDADGDGLLEICSRARDLPDKTFPSVCHMLCHNRCTRFHITEVIEGNLKKYTATAYRTNYYKLRDGPCKRT